LAVLVVDRGDQDLVDLLQVSTTRTAELNGFPSYRLTTTAVDDKPSDHYLDRVLDFETSKHAMLEHGLRPPGNAEGLGLNPTDQLFCVWN
jgi:hypothetical protein